MMSMLSLTEVLSHQNGQGLRRQATGRVSQKSRTRKALLRAARELLQRGEKPSVQDVADHASMSRATAYRYYPRIETLLQEAVVDGITEEVDGLQLATVDGVTLQERIDAVVDNIIAMVLENEALFRTYLKSAAADEEREHSGARRIKWLSDAYGRDRTHFPAKLLDRMTAALSLLTGVETVIVAKDICGLDDAGTRELCRWTARAILSAALAETGNGLSVD